MYKMFWPLVRTSVGCIFSAASMVSSVLVSISVSDFISIVTAVVVTAIVVTAIVVTAGVVTAVVVTAVVVVSITLNRVVIVVGISSRSSFLITVLSFTSGRVVPLLGLVVTELTSVSAALSG